ncbi:MAG: hypothetical protein ACI8QS_003514 [Planctomycetota bacterium]|jgi:hypothetical protein
MRMIQTNTGNRPGRLFQTLVLLRTSLTGLSLRDVYGDTFPGETSIAWFGGEHVPLASGGRERVVPIFGR